MKSVGFDFLTYTTRYLVLTNLGVHLFYSAIMI